MEMIEKVARAICNDRYLTSGPDDDGWVAATETMKEDYRGHARAAIEAMEIDAREAVAKWMIAKGVAPGHGDTLDDLLRTLVATCAERGLSVTANRYGEMPEAWQDGFDRGGTAAARAISEIINPQQPTAAQNN